jgi:hypothetical protein
MSAVGRATGDHDACRSQRAALRYRVANESVGKSGYVIVAEPGDEPRLGAAWNGLTAEDNQRYVSIRLRWNRLRAGITRKYAAWPSANLISI